MVECILIEDNGRAHFLAKQFDRITGAKVHMQMLCNIAHFDYRLLWAYSYEQVFAVMRGPRLTYKKAQEMFRRMVFNVVTYKSGRPHEGRLFPDRLKMEIAPFSAIHIGYAYNHDGQ